MNPNKLLRTSDISRFCAEMLVKGRQKITFSAFESRVICIVPA